VRFARRGRISSSSDAMIAMLHLIGTFVANLFIGSRLRSASGGRVALHLAHVSTNRKISVWLRCG
jgi:hypothetical protein